MQARKVDNDGVQRQAERPKGHIHHPHQTQLLVARDKLVETLGEMAQGFEHPPQQITHKGGDNLQLQGMGRLPHRPFDFEQPLDPFPPVFHFPSLFIQLCHAGGTQIKAVSQHPHQAAIGQAVTTTRNSTCGQPASRTVQSLSKRILPRWCSEGTGRRSTTVHSIPRFSHTTKWA